MRHATKPYDLELKAADALASRFRYVAAEDASIRPAGQRLAYSFMTEYRDFVLRRYRTNACQIARSNVVCTTGNERLSPDGSTRPCSRPCTRLINHPKK